MKDEGRRTKKEKSCSISVRFEAAAGVSAAWVCRIASAALTWEKSDMDLNVLITNDRKIKKINNQFLKHDYATDVISFSLGDSGDIVVSKDTAKRFSKELKIPYKQELARYLVHGTLHLLGYDDKNEKDKTKMHQKQEAILESICL